MPRGAGKNRKILEAQKRMSEAVTGEEKLAAVFALWSLLNPGMKTPDVLRSETGRQCDGGDGKPQPPLAAKGPV